MSSVLIVMEYAIGGLGWVC